MWSAARSAVASRFPAPAGPLYHYTDTHGLMGILGASGRDPQLWATHHAFLNDPSEGQDFRRVLQAVADRFKRSCDLASPLGKRQAHLAANLSSGLSTYQLGTTWYVTSFAEDGDHLGQWRLYGADGSGFALGLRADGLAALRTEGNDPGVLLPVVYDPTTKEEIAQIVIEQIVGALPDVTSQIPEIPQQPGEEDLLRYAAMYASSLAEDAVGATFKAPAYQSEHEWRLVFRGFDPAMLHSDQLVAAEIEHALSTLQYRISGSTIVPYVAAPILDLSGLIAEVIVGPSQSKGVTTRTLNAVLAGRRLLGPGRCFVRHSIHDYRGR
jgi:hypothetical protein